MVPTGAHRRWVDPPILQVTHSRRRWVGMALKKFVYPPLLSVHVPTTRGQMQHAVEHFAAVRTLQSWERGRVAIQFFLSSFSLTFSFTLSKLFLV